MTTPVPLAIVICDSVYVESATRKTALVGIFNTIVATRFPTTHPRLCVFVSVTDVRPGMKFKLDIVHSESDHRVVSLEGPPPQKATPTVICDLSFELHDLVFPEPGLYYVRFWGNQNLLLQRPIEVKEVRGQKESTQ